MEEGAEGGPGGGVGRGGGVNDGSNTVGGESILDNRGHHTSHHHNISCTPQQQHYTPHQDRGLYAARLGAGHSCVQGKQRSNRSGS